MICHNGVPTLLINLIQVINVNYE